MQVLAHTSKPFDSKRLGKTDPVEPAGCAHAMLDGMPPVMWFIRTQMRKHRTHGLSVPQYRALCLLDRFPTASLSQVADHLGSSQPSASRLIQGLVTRGLVERMDSPDDRRQVRLVLTPRGKTLQTASHEATQERLAEAIAHLAEADRRTIVDAMHLLTDVFDTNRQDRKA